MSQSTYSDKVAEEDALIEQLRESFVDEEYRNAYDESFLNSYIAAQIKVHREANDLTQSGLAEKIGTKQPGIARLENVNYSAWKVETLRKLARAFDVRLKISFEEWGTLPRDIGRFSRESLLRAPFARDSVFSSVGERPSQECGKPEVAGVPVDDAANTAKRQIVYEGLVLQEGQRPQGKVHPAGGNLGPIPMSEVA